MSQLVKFGDVVESIAIRVDDPKTAGVDRYVGLEHLDSETVTVSRWGSPSDVEATKLRFFIGDVIYGRRRAYQRKLGRASFEGICSAHALVLRGKAKKCLSEFLPYFLQSERFHKRAMEISVGSLSPTINCSTLKVQEFAFPSLDEQARIVELMTAVDEHLDALRSQLEVAKGSRAAVLHQLLSAVGDDWVNTTLGDIAEVIMGRQLSPSKKMGVRPKPYLRAANIGNWGINIDDLLEMDFTESEERQFASQIGDVLLVEGGNEKSVGCPALIGELEEGLCIQNTIIRCRVKDSTSLIPSFLYHSLRQSFWSGKFGELCAGTTIRHLGQKRAIIFPFDLPPIAEQKRIVEIVSSMDDVIQATEQAIAEAKVLRTTLLNQEIS